MLDWVRFCARLEEALGFAFPRSRCHLLRPPTTEWKARVVVMVPGRIPFPIEVTADVADHVGAVQLVELLVEEQILDELTNYHETGNPASAEVRLGHGEQPVPQVVWVPAA